jgi:hypothetical protein
MFEETNDLLTINELIDTVSSGKNLTHAEVEEWAAEQNENDCMQMFTYNKILENVLQ